MSNLIIKKAVREALPLLIGLVGPSGAGKTYSALLLAKGIQSVVGGDIVFADSESRRALHYADEFEFLHLDLTAPFSSLRYLEALQLAAQHGAKTVIVDSMSHEHEGEGGYLWLHETELDRMAGGDWRKRESCNFAAWIEPAKQRRKLITTIASQLKINVIFCFRAKEKIALVKQGGKTKPVPQGWQAIAGDEFVYEMTHRFLLTPGSRGFPDFSEQAMELGVPKLPEAHRSMIAGRQIDMQMGADLATWARGDKPQQRAAKSPEITKLIGELEKVSREQGRDVFRSRWEKLPYETRASIGRNERDRIFELGASSQDDDDSQVIETINRNIESCTSKSAGDMILADIETLSDPAIKQELTTKLNDALERLERANAA